MELTRKIKIVRLVVSAEMAKRNREDINPDLAPAIEEARRELMAMRGIDVVDALLKIQEGGLPLLLDIKPLVISRERAKEDERNRVAEMLRRRRFSL